MPRAARLVLPGLPHHVTQRGNNRQDVFFTEDDTIVEALRKAARNGRPLASDSFLARLETAVGRRLRPLPRGRPRKRR